MTDRKYSKGTSGNPNGRPKGSLNKSTATFSKIKALACEKYEEAFALLWKAMESGEGWAFNIYFKELLPKRLYEDTVFIDTSKANTYEEQVDIMRKGLAQFTEFTLEDILSVIKTLGAIKEASHGRDIDDAPMTSEQKEELLFKLDKTLAYIDARGADAVPNLT